MGQEIIVWAIVSVCALLVARWAYRRWSGKAPGCCAPELDASPCASCAETPEDLPSGKCMHC